MRCQIIVFPSILVLEACLADPSKHFFEDIDESPGILQPAPRNDTNSHMLSPDRANGVCFRSDQH